jgi:hypothetical protein
VDCGNDESFDIMNSITIELWVKPASFQLEYTSIIGNHNFNYTGWVIEQESTNLNKFRFIYGNGSSWQGTSFNTQLINDKWQHFVVQKDGTIVRHFLNGAQTGTVNVSGDINLNANSLQIGKWSAYNGRYFNGLIDEVRIYNRALSAEEIKRHYEMSK